MFVRKISVFLAAICLFFAAEKSHRVIATTLPGDWVPHGTVLGGAFNVIAVGTSVDMVDTIIAGNDDGVLISTDGGATWTATGLPEISVQDIAFSPDFSMDTTIFAATKDHGLYESTDGGITWLQVNGGLESLNVRSILLTPNFTNVSPCAGSIFLGTDNGLYKADNSSCSLTFSLWGTQPLNSSIRDLAFVPPTDLYVVTESNGTSGGSIYNVNPDIGTWTEIRGIFPNDLTTLGLGATDSIISIWVSPNGPTTIYIGCDSKGPFISQDNGTNWTDRSATQCGGAVYNFKETPSSDFSTTGIVYLATVNGLKRGSYFDNLASCVGERPDNYDIYSIALTPNYNTGAGGAKAGLMYLATGNGILQKTPGGIPTSPSNDTKRITVADVKPNPRLGKTLLGDDTVVAYIPSVGIVRSDDKGRTFLKMNPIVLPDISAPTNTVPTFTGITFSNSWRGRNALCNSDEATMAFSTSTGGVYLSNDGGLTVRPLNNIDPLGEGGTLPSQTYAIAFSPNFANAPDIIGTVDRSIYVAKDGGIYRAQIMENTPFTSTWFNTGNLPSTGGISSLVRNITFPPDFSLLDTDHREVFATVNPDSQGLLFGGIIKSLDGGASWNTLTTFPCNNADITTIALSPNYRVDSTIYVATMGCGVLMSSDGGLNWCSLPFPDGDAFINSLSISPNYLSDGMVLVSTAPTHPTPDQTVTHGIWRWTNGGSCETGTWTPQNQGLINPSTGTIANTTFVAYSQNIPTESWVATAHQGIFYWYGSSWQQSGGFRSTPLDITSMAVDVTDPTRHTIFAGTSNEGVWISTDRGETYRPMNRGLHNNMTDECLPPISSLEIWYDAANANAHLLAGTGVGNSGSGIYYYSVPLAPGSPAERWLPSLTNDVTWLPSTLVDGVFSSFTTLSPHQGFILAARSDPAPCHLYRSADGGMTWGCIDSGIEDTVTYVFNSGESGTGFGNGPFSPSGSISWSTTSNSGVEKSNNSGSFKSGFTPTWVFANGSGIGTLTDLQTRAVIQLDDGATGVYATVLTGTVSGGVFRSVDEGDYSWVASSSGLEGTSMNVKDFMQNSTNGDVLVALRDTNGGSPGNGGAYLSGDKGRHWTSLNSGFDQNYNDLADLISDPGPPVVYYTGGTNGPFENPVEAKAYPTVTSIGTTTGPSTGGTVVDIYGTNFDSACIAAFGDEDAVTTSFIDSEHVQATTPPSAPGSVKVGVRNPDTRRADCSTTFTYTDAGEGDGITLTMSKSGGVQLDWTPSGNMTIKRATDPQMTTNVSNQSVSGTTYTDTTGALTDGNTYYYKVW